MSIFKGKGKKIINIFIQHLEEEEPDKMIILRVVFFLLFFIFLILIYIYSGGSKRAVSKNVVGWFIRYNRYISTLTRSRSM